MQGDPESLNNFNRIFGALLQDKPGTLNPKGRLGDFRLFGVGGSVRAAVGGLELPIRSLKPQHINSHRALNPKPRT